MRVSCVALTTTGRLPLLRWAILDFTRQTHGNRELIVVIDRDPVLAAAVRRYVAAIVGHDIRIVQSETKLPLGSLRNLGIEAATGDVLCQWDDDDRYSAGRLAHQLGTLNGTGADACFLHDQLYYFTDREEVHCVDWRYHRGMPIPLTWRTVIPGTVMWRRSSARYPAAGPGGRIGEDTLFARHLALGHIVAVPNRTYCYLRVFHGGNVCTRRHHERAARVRGLSAGQVRRERIAIESVLSELDVPVVSVMSGRQAVFTPGGYAAERGEA
ncbi:MAG: glycosyltransferase family A protein [Gemmatimonadaceae bacterium]